MEGLAFARGRWDGRLVFMCASRVHSSCICSRRVCAVSRSFLELVIMPLNLKISDRMNCNSCFSCPNSITVSSFQPPRRSEHIYSIKWTGMNGGESWSQKERRGNEREKKQSLRKKQEVKQGKEEKGRYYRKGS